MLIAVGLQVLAVFVGAVMAWIVGGSANGGAYAWYFFLGGASATLPSALFAWRLSRHRNKPAESYPVVFVAGELLKILLTMGMLGWVVKTQANIQWLPMLLGLIVGLKAPLFSLWFSGDRSDRIVREAQERVEQEKILASGSKDRPAGSK
jgi:F0F1-type ATP synthase assembly protein I